MQYFGKRMSLYLRNELNEEKLNLEPLYARLFMLLYITLYSISLTCTYVGPPCFLGGHAEILSY